MKTIDEKYRTVIENNTYYYFDEEFESAYESHIFSVKESIYNISKK